MNLPILIGIAVGIIMAFIVVKLTIPLSREINHKIFPENTFMRKLTDYRLDNYFKFWYVGAIVVGGYFLYLYFTGQL